MKLLVSACLLGVPCRYDGASKLCDAVSALAKTHTLIPFCPEIYGGLPTPRLPSECRDGRVIRADGTDVTDAYGKGAEQALRLCRMLGIDGAILKSKSPSCGKGLIYDGSFTGMLTERDGVTAELLKKHGLRVYGESELAALDNL